MSTGSGIGTGTGTGTDYIVFYCTVQFCRFKCTLRLYCMGAVWAWIKGPRRGLQVGSKYLQVALKRQCTLKIISLTIVLQEEENSAFAIAIAIAIAFSISTVITTVPMLSHRQMP
jgi:hypothetical protein